MGVLLGLVDERIQNVAADWKCNKFGGLPDWMIITDNTQVQPRCLRCSCNLYLVSQVYCPLINSDYHRTIYVFGCVTQSCWNQPDSFTVVRCQQREKESKHSVQKLADDDDWGTNEWFKDASGEMENNKEDTSSDNGDLSSIVERFKTFFKLSECCDSPPLFTPYFIFVNKEEEIVSQFDQNNHEMKLYENYQRDDQNCSNKKDGNDFAGKETYEKTRYVHGDRAFHQFAKKIRHCPEQCLRYEWNGNPLLLSDQSDVVPDIKMIPKCDHCGSHRVFEMQLMPHLTNYLHFHHPTQIKPNVDTFCSLLQDSQDGLDIDFGCIYIYTCSKSCWTDNVDVAIIEVAAVHPDPETLKLIEIKNNEF